MRSLSRRGFLGSAIAGAVAPTIIPSAAFGRKQAAPSARVCAAIVGLGSRGFNLIDDFLRQADAQFVAVCDVDALHYRDLPSGKGPAYGRDAAKSRIEKYYAQKKASRDFRGLKVFSDYRELCALAELDAVIVATPDHWHVLCALEALRQGKDVYCEKPLTHTFHEGRVLCREAAKRQAVFQVGSQQRSWEGFRHVVRLVRNGVLGKVRRVEVGLPPGYDRPMGDTTVRVPPEHLDYNFWCGPSEELPYMRARHHRWWRGHRAYGGGVLMDWIGHHNDIAHWGLGMDTSGPTRVEAVGWEFPPTDVYNTPMRYEIRCEYAGGITSSISSQNAMGTRFVGDDGWIHVARGRKGGATITASHARWTSLDFDPGPISVYESPGHARNFLDCCKSRQPCVAPPEVAHRSITPGHLAYVSQALGRALLWDAEREQVLHDEDAQRLLMRQQYRPPWRLDA